MYYQSNSRDKRYFDLYNVQVSTGEKGLSLYLIIQER